MPWPLDQLKAAIFFSFKNRYITCWSPFCNRWTGRIEKKAGYMNATLKMSKVRNNHFSYLHSSALQLFQWYFFMVDLRKSWTKSTNVAIVCEMPHFCADTVLLNHSSSLSAQLLLHLLVFHSRAHSKTLWIKLHTAHSSNIVPVDFVFS